MANSLRGGESYYNHLQPASGHEYRNQNTPGSSIFSQNSHPGLNQQHRTGRLFRPLQQPSQQQSQFSPFSATSSQQDQRFYDNTISHHPGLEDPFVASTLIAGLVGLTLTIIIILSVWILRRSRTKKRPSTAKNGRNHEKADANGDDVESRISSHKQNTDMIVEIQQAQGGNANRYHSDLKPKSTKKGNILSKKNKKPTTNGPSTGSNCNVVSNPNPISDVGNPGDKAGEVMPVRVLKETFV